MKKEDNGTETSVITYHKEYNPCKESLEKSLHKLNSSFHQVTIAIPEEEGECDFQNYCHYGIPNVQFSTKKLQSIPKRSKVWPILRGKKKEKKLTGTFPEEAQALDWLNKDFKCGILNMLKGLKGTVDEEQKEIKRIIYGQVGDIIRETEIIKEETK